MAKRLFVSVDLPDRLQEGIDSAQAPFADIPGLRLTDPDQTHVTMKFLGDVPADRIRDVEAAIERAIDDSDVAPFEARFGGLGVFPDFDYISVVWIGAREGGVEFERLHHALEEELVALGFDEEEHDFTPHVTVARMDHAEGKDEVQRLLRTRDPDIGAMEVTEVALTESTLTSEGPVYETLETFQLDPPSR